MWRSPGPASGAQASTSHHHSRGGAPAARLPAASRDARVTLDLCPPGFCKLEFLAKQKGGLLIHRKPSFQTTKRCLPSLRKADVVIGLTRFSFEAYFTKIVAAGVGTCGFFNSDVLVQPVEFT